jgi:hypothetical protein
MMANDKIKDAVHELWYWQYGTNPSNFTSKLFELMQHADLENQQRLASAFPIEYQALELWMIAQNQRDFFKQWGIDI